MPDRSLAGASLVHLPRLTYHSAPWRWYTHAGRCLSRFRGRFTVQIPPEHYQRPIRPNPIRYTDRVQHPPLRARPHARGQRGKFNRGEDHAALRANRPDSAARSGIGT